MKLRPLYNKAKFRLLENLLLEQELNCLNPTGASIVLKYLEDRGFSKQKIDLFKKDILGKPDFDGIELEEDGDEFKFKKQGEDFCVKIDESYIKEKSKLINDSIKELEKLNIDFQKIKNWYKNINDQVFKRSKLTESEACFFIGLFALTSPNTNVFNNSLEAAYLMQIYSKKKYGKEETANIKDMIDYSSKLLKDKEVLKKYVSSLKGRNNENFKKYSTIINKLDKQFPGINSKKELKDEKSRELWYNIVKEIDINEIFPKIENLEKGNQLSDFIKKSVGISGRNKLKASTILSDFFESKNYNVTRKDLYDFLKSKTSISKKIKSLKVKDSLGGIKVTMFCMNLLDPEEEFGDNLLGVPLVTMDTHMVRFMLPKEWVDFVYKSSKSSEEDAKDIFKFVASVFNNTAGIYSTFSRAVDLIRKDLELSYGLKLKNNQLQSLAWFVAINSWGRDEADSKKDFLFFLDYAKDVVEGNLKFSKESSVEKTSKTFFKNLETLKISLEQIKRLRGENKKI